MRQRRAFTLVEMLVSMALIIFIMVILTQAFVAGLETFRQLKAIGDMEQRMRAVTAALREDLAADHFEGRRRLSDPDFWQFGPPREGCFRVWQGSQPVFEGYDADGVPSFRATDHALHYTVRRRGNRRENFFAARVIDPRPQGRITGDDVLLQGTTFFEADLPGSSRFQDPITYTSQWAEVAVFLRPNGTTTQGLPAGTTGTIPLFGLYRRQQLLVPDNRRANFEAAIHVTGITNTQVPLDRFLTGDASNPAQFEAIFAGISCTKKTPDYTTAGAFAPPDNTLYFNNPSDVTIPQRRFGMAQSDLPTTLRPNPNVDTYNGVLPGGFPVRGGITLDTQNGYAPELTYPIFGDLEGPRQNPRLPLLRQDTLRQGTDLLLNDVISMEVGVLVSDLPSRADVPQNGQFNGAQPSFVHLFDDRLDPLRRGNPMYYLPTGAARFRPAVYDTWSSQRNEIYDYSGWAATGQAVTAASVPLMTNTTNRLLALKITLRVWDQKTQQARQVTLIQDL